MKHIKEMTSASGVPVRMEVEQVLNHRGLVIGKATVITLLYGEGGKGREFKCQDTKEDAPRWKEIRENFLDDKRKDGRPFKGKEVNA